MNNATQIIGQYQLKAAIKNRNRNRGRRAPIQQPQGPVTVLVLDPTNLSPAAQNELGLTGIRSNWWPGPPKRRGHLPSSHKSGGRSALMANARHMSQKEFDAKYQLLLREEKANMKVQKMGGMVWCSDAGSDFHRRGVGCPIHAVHECRLEDALNQNRKPCLHCFGS